MEAAIVVETRPDFTVYKGAIEKTGDEVLGISTGPQPKYSVLLPLGPSRLSRWIFALGRVVENFLLHSLNTSLGRSFYRSDSAAQHGRLHI